MPAFLASGGLDVISCGFDVFGDEEMGTTSISFTLRAEFVEGADEDGIEPFAGRLCFGSI